MCLISTCELCITRDVISELLHCLYLQPREAEVPQSLQVNVSDVIILEDQPLEVRQIFQSAGANKRQFVV